MTVDMELVDEVLAWIRNNPERHDQSLFVARGTFDLKTEKFNFCNTTFCFAGAALMLRNQVEFDELFGCSRPIQHNSFEDAAREILGFTQWQTEMIFYSGEFNTFDDFKAYVLDVLEHDPAACGHPHMHFSKSNCSVYRNRILRAELSGD